MKLSLCNAWTLTLTYIAENILFWLGGHRFFPYGSWGLQHGPTLCLGNKSTFSTATGVLCEWPYCSLLIPAKGWLNRWATQGCSAGVFSGINIITGSSLFLITMKSLYRGNNRAKPDLNPSDVMAILQLKLFTDTMTVKQSPWHGTQQQTWRPCEKEGTTQSSNEPHRRWCRTAEALGIPPWLQRWLKASRVQLGTQSSKGRERGQQDLQGKRKQTSWMLAVQGCYRNQCCRFL